MAEASSQRWYCGHLETREIREVEVLRSSHKSVWIADIWGPAGGRERRVDRVGTMRVYAPTIEEVRALIVENYRRHVARMEATVREHQIWLDHYRKEYAAVQEAFADAA